MKKQLGFVSLFLWLFLIGLAATLPAAVTDDLVFYVPFTADMNDQQGGLEANVRG
jgi:hypothetical protein